jgi:hypothetical protein
MSTRSAAALAASLLITGLVLPARAETTEGEPPGGFGRWYGWQTLTTDGLAMGMTLGSFAYNGDGNVVTLLGLGTFALGAPVVHAFHGRFQYAFGSLALRVGLPLLALGVASSECSGECGGLILLDLILIPLAIIGPPVIDAGLFAWEKPEPVQRGLSSVVGSLRPFLLPGRRRVLVGLSGTL